MAFRIRPTLNSRINTVNTPEINNTSIFDYNNYDTRDQLTTFDNENIILPINTDIQQNIKNETLISYNMDINIKDITKLCILPYDGEKYEISTIFLVMSGNSTVIVQLSDITSNKIIHEEQCVINNDNYNIFKLIINKNLIPINLCLLQLTVAPLQNNTNVHNIQFLM